MYIKIKSVFEDISDDDHEQFNEKNWIGPNSMSANQAVSIYIEAYIKHESSRLTINSGTSGNMIRASTAISIAAEIQKVPS